MTRRDRMLRTMRGEAVDRPAVNFYELNGLDENPADADSFNVFNHPSWKPLIDLARERTDRIVMRGLRFKDGTFFPWDSRVEWERKETDESVFTTGKLKAGNRTLTMRLRRDRDINTTWTLEHWLKDEEDLKAWLELPWEGYGVEPDVTQFLETEKALGDTGIAMMSVADPLCFSAELFGMEDYILVAFSEQDLFRQALDRFAQMQVARMVAATKALPGRLWRIVGPEYASPPYMPPDIFREFVGKYDKPMIDAIHASGGWARIHSHGKLRDILPCLCGTGADGLDPVEPPPQGDVELSYVRKEYGKQLVLFGNIEIADIENLPAGEFAVKVRTTLEQGTAGPGRGFVLQPSACPLGRELTSRAMRNYEIMVDMNGKFQ